VRQADHDRVPHKLYLFYSNRRPEDAPFLEALQKLEKTDSNFRFVGTMTEMPRSKKKWDGETGWIDKEMLSRPFKQLAGTDLLHRRTSRYGHRNEENARQIEHRRGRHPDREICGLLKSDNIA